MNPLLAPALAALAATSGAALGAPEAQGADAAREAPASPAPVFLLLVLNGAEHEPILVYLDGQDALVSASDLADAGLRIEGGSSRLLEGAAYTSLASLAPALAWRVDERSLSLLIDADPQRLSRNALRMSGASPVPAGITYTQDRSAFLNYSARVFDLSSLELYSEAGASARSLSLYTAATLQAGDRPVRGLSNLTIDRRLRLQRVVIGDVLAEGGPLGGGAFLGGAQVARTGELDPYHAPGRLSLDRVATVAVPSTLEVYTNGQLTHREEVPPGPLDIRDIPITMGAGEVRVLLRDSLGREQELTEGYYGLSRVLAPGQQEYSYSLGAQRENFGSASWDYGAPAAMGLHRCGVFRWLTLGLQSEATPDLLNGGVNAVGGARFGQIEAAGAASAAGEAAGTAWSLAWAYIAPEGSVSLYSLRLSDSYARLGLDLAADRARSEYGGLIGIPISPRVGFLGAYAARAMRDSGASQRATVAADVALPRQIQSRLQCGWSRGGAGAEALDVSLSLRGPLGRRTAAAVSAERSGEGGQLSAQIQRALPEGPGVGYRAGAQAGADPAASASVESQTSFAWASASYDWTPDFAASSVGVAGGLVAIGGRLFFTRPVEQSYALARLPGVDNARIYLNNNEVGRTDARGDLLVSGLLPYYGNRLSFEPLDLPLYYDIAGTERVIAPPPRAGALVTFPARPTQVVRGRIEVPGGDAAYGELTLSAGGEVMTSPIGVGGVFELEEVPIGQWRIDVRYPGGRCSAVLEIPASELPTLDVGSLPCAPSGGEDL